MTKLLYFFLVLLGFSYSCNDTKARSKLSPNDFEQMLAADASIQLVDVRTPAEFSSGYIAGAKNMNIHGADFATQIATLDKSKPVAIYCAKGGRSASAAEKLSEAGFSKVFDLEGGMSAWKAAGKKTAR